MNWLKLWQRLINKLSQMKFVWFTIYLTWNCYPNVSASEESFITYLIFMKILIKTMTLKKKNLIFLYRTLTKYNKFTRNKPYPVSLPLTFLFLSNIKTGRTVVMDLTIDLSTSLWYIRYINYLVTDCSSKTLHEEDGDNLYENCDNL